MTLLNAPEFDERKENRRRNIWVGSGIFIAVMVVLTVAAFCWARMALHQPARRSTG